MHGKLRVTGFHSEKSGNEYDTVVFFQDRKDSNGKDKVGFEIKLEKKRKFSRKGLTNYKYSVIIIIRIYAKWDDSGAVDTVFKKKQRMVSKGK